MVRKASKCGLNTGNTIRKPSSVTGRTAYDYIAVHRDAEFGNDYKAQYNRLSKVIPSSHNDGVQYSLSKKQRWELIPYLRELAEPDEGNTEEKVNLYVHEQRLHHCALSNNNLTAIQMCPTIVEFHTNIGPVQSKVSRSSMNMKTADLARLDIDHLSKRERRKLGRKKFSEMRDGEKEVSESLLKDVTSTLNCHVVERAPKTSQLYTFEGHRDLDLYLPQRGRRKHRAGKIIKTEEYLKDYDDDDDDCVDENEESVTVPRTTSASIADYLENQQRTQRFESTSSDGSSSSSCSFKGNFHFLSRQSSTCHDSTSAEVSPDTKMETSHFSPAPKSTKLELSRDDMSVGALKAIYGDDYEESYCSPRVFNIRLSASNYLILHQNGYGSNVFRAHVSGDSEFNISTIIPVSSLHELVTVARTTLANTVKDEQLWRKTGRVNKRNRLYANAMKNWQITTQQFVEFTQDILKEEIKLVKDKVMEREIDDSFVMVPRQINRSESTTLYCGVCFNELDHSESTETAFTGLLPCNHIFCHECWSTHIQSQLAQATVRIQCAEYNCNSEVDPVLVRSAVEYRLFQRFIERKAELLLQIDDTTIFCPNQRCNKVIGMKGSLVNKEPVTVSCDCGTSVCLVCQKDPHWPIPCDLVHKYTDALKKDGLYNSAADFGKSYVVVVNYKPCPKCKLPIEKNGGCVHMVCSKCCTSFCWQCLVPYTGTQYYHECPQTAVKGKQAEFTSTYPSMGRHYSLAVRQRCHIGGVDGNRSINIVLKKIRQFLSSINMRQSHKYAEEGVIETLPNKLKHIMIYCHAARRLLENCSAFNHVRRGKFVLCPNKLSLLELHVDTIDQLTEQKCSSKVIDSIFDSYTKAKKTSDIIIAQFSDCLYGQN